jgi:hypothetical protein
MRSGDVPFSLSTVKGGGSSVDWSDANPTDLELHDPEPTDVVITLGSIH